MSNEQPRRNAPNSIASMLVDDPSPVPEPAALVTEVENTTENSVNGNNSNIHSTSIPISNIVNGNPKLSTATPTPSSTPATKKPKLESREASVDLEAIKNDGPPVHEIVGGSSVRQYLNKHLTKHLLEGLREIGSKKPEDPLEFLGHFLLERSQEEKQKNAGP
ncbi:uncharacterized protein RJT20DRAFT_134354 [Scheffersomyces xylosifermentans]|uniref:uncharacterized protein n=1 Tax=Scheffersomyces xylosifermentans TaxID=1304137 RepID=UPI00315D6781